MNGVQDIEANIELIIPTGREMADARTLAFKDLQDVFGDEAVTHVQLYESQEREYNDVWLTWFELRIIMYMEGHTHTWFNHSLNQTLLSQLKVLDNPVFEQHADGDDDDKEECEHHCDHDCDPSHTCTGC
jgi:hypothetical protein